MAIFRVYEVQEETFTRKWMYEVEADNAAAALDRAQGGEAEPIDCGTSGDGDFGASGWGVGNGDECQAWADALEDMTANLF